MERQTHRVFVFSDKHPPTESGEDQWCIRNYENWDVLAVFPDTQEGYEAGHEWVAENGYEFVPWN